MSPSQGPLGGPRPSAREAAGVSESEYFRGLFRESSSLQGRSWIRYFRFHDFPRPNA
jgi:hypothetical protein